MAQKRKKESGPDEPTGRDAKKQKMAVARTIETQSSTDVGGHDGAASGRSHTTNSMKNLPSAIDVEKFTEARAFEIDAMQKAMKSASGSSTQRAWQALPRHLRRRAASHDVRRVPLRLREKARSEMDPVKQKAQGGSMPKKGKVKRGSRTESLLKRQRDKTWLETHIWHAKRMKMEDIWGYRLAMHTTEKSFRPSHRASVHGSILHDASYYSLIELKGREDILRTILETCCDYQGSSPAAKGYVDGSRVMETHIHKPASYPFDLIAPITIIWKPTCLSSEPPADSAPQNTTNVSEPTAEPSTSNRKRKRKGQNKEKEKEPHSSPETLRTVWIRSHPVVFEDVFQALETATSLELDEVSKRCKENVEVELADLRGQVNVFEVMGPKSSQIIKGAMTPVGEDKREPFRKVWASLSDLQTSGSLPRGMIIGFEVYDPRLKYPPKNPKPKVGQPTAVVTFPTPILAQSAIWDETTRARLKQPRYKKKDLDDRRSKNLIPGTTLRPMRKDDRVPVMLIQHSLEKPLSTSESQSVHGWTLIVPAGWSMAFFSSLTYTGTRVGGQQERQVQSFESGSAYFARDYPSTAAYEAYANVVEAEEKARWERKPPAKRANFEKLGTRSPWKADWEVVLGMKRAEEDETDFVTTQRDVGPVEGGVGIRPWLLRGSNVPSILKSASNLFNPAAGLWSELNTLRIKRGQDPLSSSIKADMLWKSALVVVRLSMCGRGAPGDLAVIYFIEDEEVREWKKALEQKKRLGHELDEDNADETKLSVIRPSPINIIGYVTTGNFSLSRGEGFCIGVIPVARLFELREQSQRLHRGAKAGCFDPKVSPLLVKVRQRDGDRCRAAYLEPLDGW